MRARCCGEAGLDGEGNGLDGPALCIQILRGLDVEDDGFCKISKLKPSKDGGYVQLSWGGANKFAVLQEVLLWARGVILEGNGDQCSHLCGKTLCTLPKHICKESAEKNNNRKGCVVWWDCPHCPKKILICCHEPKCIKFAPGFATWEDFLQNGIH
jgi:hypothetical protein